MGTRVLAARGDVGALRAALEAGADPNPRAGELAPLYLARTTEVIAALLEHGANPNWQVVDALAEAGAALERVHDGWTALAIAVDHGRPRSRTSTTSAARTPSA